MNAVKADFFVTGGTLRRDSLSYVVRDADEKVFQGLSKGEFCYVLTPRQMGKSSLMVRTAGRLRDQGVTVVVLDLTGIGSNLTADQWYEGLLNNIGTQLDLEDELDDYWDDNSERSPLQRWLGAIRKIVLPSVKEHLVVFVDEIDMVRSLAFSTDEFFASIREFHNSRSINPNSEKITFCLLGVAAPADLISNPLITPFNIGKRIELKDFTEEQAKQLAEGIDKGANSFELVHRVLYWTGGHPYLTQKLCLSISADKAIHSVRQVDTLCHKMFLSSQARDKDINLSFVRDRMLKSDDDIATLLDIYSRVYKGQHVPANEKNPIFDTLKLSGIVRIIDGEFKISNRIYDHVFDKGWIIENMPGAELRRQRREFWRGVIRTAAVAVIIVGIISTLAGYAIVQRKRAINGQSLAKQYLYAAEINLASRALEDGNLGRAYSLLNKNSRSENKNWEWNYLWEMCKNDQIDDLGVHDHIARDVAVSPDGNNIASGSHDNSVRITNIKTKVYRDIIIGYQIFSVEFSPDGNELAFGGQSGGGIIDPITMKPIKLPFKIENANTVTYSDSGKYFAFANGNQVLIWNRKNGETLNLKKSNFGYGRHLSFSFDDKYIIIRNNDGPRIYNIDDKQFLDRIKENSGMDGAVSFFNKKNKFVASNIDGKIKIWNFETGEVEKELDAHNAWIPHIIVTSDDKYLISSSADQSIKIWDTKNFELLCVLTGHRNEVWGIDLSSDDKFIYSGSKDYSLKVWDAKSRDNRTGVYEFKDKEEASNIVNDGKHYISVYESGNISLKSTLDLKEVFSTQYNTNKINYAISPKLNYSANSDKYGNIELINYKNSKKTSIYDVKASTRGTFFDQLSFSKNEEYLRVIEDKKLTFIDLKNNKILKTFPFVFTTGFTVSGDEKLCVIYGWGEDSKLFNLSNNRVITAFVGHGQRVVGAAISHNKSLIATISFDATTRLWNANNGEELGVLKGQLLSPHAVVFSRDDKRLFVATGEGTIKIWDVALQTELMTIKTDRKYAHRIALNNHESLCVKVGNSLQIFKSPITRNISLE